MGYVAAPGTITGPRGVAAWGRKVAVGAGCVLLYEGSGVSWIMVCVIGNAVRPCGLRFSHYGQELVVAADRRARILRVNDGAFVQTWPRV